MIANMTFILNTFFLKETNMSGGKGSYRVLKCIHNVYK